MAKYVPVTDYASALVYNRAGMLDRRSSSEGKWYSSSKETDYYDHPDKPGNTRWSNDIDSGIEHAILVEEDDDGEGSG